MEAERWDHIFQGVLREVLAQEQLVALGKSSSVGSGRETLEVINHIFKLSNPRDRILWNPIRKFDLYGAIARFFWMLSGNERLKDIEFYQPKVLRFSDDALTVPGSNYGKRLFMPEPGLDQVRAIIERVQKDPGTRRAAAVIYRPEDAVRDSRDIPCAFGLALHVRGGQLHMTMIMRSNAAWGLLPYNVFEFTLLAELMSVLSDIPLGAYTHYALSMHIYKGSGDATDEIESATKSVAYQITQLPQPMAPMPKTTFDDLKRIIQWEADLRYSAKGINVTNYRDYVDKSRKFQPYWTDLCLPLLAYALFVNKKIDAGMKVLEEVGEPLRQALRQHPLVNSLNVLGLEEDPLLLESRLNLLRYANEAHVDEGRREVLWRSYESESQLELNTVKTSERRRQVEVVSVRGWERRDKEQRQQEQEPSKLL